MLGLSLLYMRLFSSHNSGYAFGRLIKLTRVVFCPSGNCFFFNFIFQDLVDWELIFIIYFNLIFYGLSWSHDPGHGFVRLTRVDSHCFFFNFILQHKVFFKKIKLHNLFWFYFYGIIIVSRLGVWICKLI
jgi:hypothetical protein